MKKLFISVLLFSTCPFAGSFAPAADQPGSTAIHWSSQSIIGWATNYENYFVGNGVLATFQTPLEALGQSDADDDSNPDNTEFSTVTLGRSGTITLTFNSPITNGDGPDFAVFENSFSDTFLELAWVEVSSDGINFTRYPNQSNTANPVNAFGSVDPTNITGYAGKYRAGYGVPFDLNDLAGAPNLDINNITHVKIIDIVGDGTALDSPASGLTPLPIYDPYPTQDSAGFDLDAIAVMHFADVEEVPVNVPVPYFYLFLLSVPFVLTHKRLKQNSIR